jgi:1-acyl-sn-glycerol-3-phosphate acyltransferase
MTSKQILGDDPFGQAADQEEAMLDPGPPSHKKGGAKMKVKVKAGTAAAAAVTPTHRNPEKRKRAQKGERRSEKPADKAEAGPPTTASPPPADQVAASVADTAPKEQASSRALMPTLRERLGYLPHPASEHARRHLPFSFFAERYRAIAMRDRSDIVDEFGRDPRVSARVDPILDFLYRTYFRVDARGLGHIPDEGRALIVSIHSGTLPYDGAMIMHAVRQERGRDVRPLVEDFVFHFPYLGTLMNRIGGVRACPENAERLLNQDQLVAVFPEGIKGIGKLFRDRYRLQRFGRGGFIKLALRSDAPIIPTAVVGAEEIHPMLTKLTWLTRSIGVPYIPITPTFPLLGPLGVLPLPTKWVIAFGEPLYFNAEHGREGAGDRILVNKLAEQVRQRIQEMIDKLLQQRRSMWLG